MSQRVKRQQKRPRHLNEYVLGTNHSKYSEQAKSAMEYSDESDENITFIHPKPKIAKLNKVVNPNEAPNAEVDSSKETEVDSSQETKVDSSKETEVDSSKETKVDSSKEKEVDSTKETEAGTLVDEDVGKFNTQGGIPILPRTPPKIAKPSEAFHQTSSSDEDETPNTGNILANV